VNGVREPTIITRPCEVQRWRILHAGWQDDIFMDLEGHTLNPIARDGIPLSRMGLTVPRKPDQPTDYPNAMLMAPGQRIDVLVQAGKPGTYAFLAVPYDQGYAGPHRANRPARDRGRSADHEPPRQTSSSVGEAHRR
jgi:FtsP/CotA-like multicopper oxidase with cupredoxin domain